MSRSFFEVLNPEQNFAKVWKQLHNTLRNKIFIEYKWVEQYF